MLEITMLEALHHVDGRWSDLGGTARFVSVDPATGRELGHVVDGGAPAIDAAIAAARRTFDQTHWSNDPRWRARVLLNMGQRLETNLESIATLLTQENGKLLSESRVEVTNAVSMCFYTAGLARNLFGRTVEVEPDVYALLPREAVGIAGIIVPWNAPIGLLFRSLTAALAAGCTVVIKAAPQTALTTAAALRIALDDPMFPA
ncbi:MAG: aldehyde dehydrogenase family protein, partial [Mycobacterium sp.]